MYIPNKMFLKQGPVPHPHIGNLIRKIAKEKRLSNAEIARRIGVRSNTYAAYLEQPSVQYAIVWKIGIAIEYNFFADIMAALPQPIIDATQSVFQETIAKQQQEIVDLKKEIEIYKNLLTSK